jgi:mannan endo-1,4-beta-mannosidase
MLRMFCKLGVMNLLAVIFLALAALAATSPANIPIRADYPSPSGLKFDINGNVTYFAGTNSYWISFLTDDADVDLVMSHLKTANLKVLRVWGEAKTSNSSHLIISGLA